MKRVFIAIFLVYIDLFTGEAQLPEVPEAFSADVILTLPIFGDVQGKLYYDYQNNKQRVDTAGAFGSITIDRYDLGYEYQIAGGQCEQTQLDGPIPPMSIPPFAVYSGEATIRGIQCDLYDANFIYFDLTFCVTNTTDPSGKTVTVMVQFAANVQGISFIYFFDNVIPGPQDASLFEVGSYGCTPPPPPVTYSVSGYVKSAIDNSVISGATVSMVGVGKTTTDSTGIYTFTGVPPNSYVTIAAANGFFKSSSVFNVSQDVNAGTTSDFSLSPTLPASSYRVVLTWGVAPRDLDSHLNTPYGCEVSYSNKVCSGASGSASLDVDDTSSYGPETVTIKATSGIFTYFVYNYSNEAPLSVSSGRVQVYDSTGLVQDLKIPVSGYPSSYRHWNVFSVDTSSGAITVQNTVSA